MAEIYRNAVNKAVEFTLPSTVATVTSAKIVRADEEFTGVTTVVGGKTVVRVPFGITRYDGKFKVVYTATVEGVSETVEQEHVVVTPLFTKEELVAFDPDFNSSTDDEIIYLERIIRSLFETITGQSFGLEKRRLTVKGSGGASLILPKRAAEPKGPSFGDYSDGNYALVTNDGWMLERFSVDSWIDVFEPRTGPGSFKSGKAITLSGLWGYLSVPEDIHLAAMTLASDYGCDTSVWRDRYMKSVGVADMRFTFMSQAFSWTGNVKVDQILDRFTRVRMVIV